MIEVRRVRISWFSQHLQWVIAVLIFLLLPWLIPLSFVHLLSEVFIYAIFATALNLVLGYGGMISFGHACFFGIGAYTVALILTKTTVPMPLALLAAPIFSAIAAFIIGFFAVKAVRLYFALLTLAFSQLVWVIIFKWYDFTRGDDGIIGVIPPGFISSETNWYYFCFLLMALSLIILWRIVNSPFGKVLQAIRDNVERTEFTGVNVFRHRLIAFIISAFFSGLAGGLICLHIRGAFPSFVDWPQSGNVLLMCLLGGMHTFLGPAVGAALIVFLDKITSIFTIYWPLIMGIILVLCVLFFRSGVLGTIQEWQLQTRGTNPRWKNASSD